MTMVSQIHVSFPPSVTNATAKMRKTVVVIPFPENSQDVGLGTRDASSVEVGIHEEGNGIICS